MWLMPVRPMLPSGVLDTTIGPTQGSNRGRAHYRPTVPMVCLVVGLIASLASIWLRGRVPVPLGLGGPDDMLFVRSAIHLANGEWLGPYDDITLAKGPSYPMFIATAHWLGVEVKLAEQATYLLACLVIAFGFWYGTRRTVLSTGIYETLALDPFGFSFDSASLMRDNWYSSLGLLFLGAVFLALVIAIRGGRLIWIVLSSLFAGLVGATFWLCREEAVTIVPAVAIIVLGLPLLRVGRWLRLPKHERFSATVICRARRFSLSAIVIAVSLAVPTAAVGMINEDRYGVRLTNDYSVGAFARAYADWTRVDGGSTMFSVPLTYRQRALVYEVSPAARELEAYMESGDKGFAVLSCKAPHCDFPGAHMGWEIRLAAKVAGHYESGQGAQEYFSRLDSEIIAGCESGFLRCTPQLPVSLQPLQRTSLKELSSYFRQLISITVFSTNVFDPPVAVWPDAQNQLQLTRGVVHGLPADAEAAAAQMDQFLSVSWPYDILRAVYTWLLPPLALIALAMLVAGWRRARWPFTSEFILLGALLAAYLTRTAALAVVKATDYDAAASRYQMPGHVLLMAFAVIGTAVAAHKALRRREQRAASALEPAFTEVAGGEQR